MKKLFFLLLTTLFFNLLVNAQSPLLLNYQGVARNSFGNALPNRLMTIRLSIRTNSIAGPVVYAETRNVTTNSGGLYAVQIGSSGASNITGSISSIDWQGENKFLQVEVDPNAGNNFIDLGTTQLVSVPYAFAANVATPIGTAGGDLTGNYPNPSVANGAITTIKLADASVSTIKLVDQSVITSKLADGAVTDAKIVTVSGAKVTGNITGNATNVTGVVAIANGGTGAIAASAARTNLGLGNVDNTSDLNKPISTATQAALDTKENLSNKSVATSLGSSNVLYPTQNAVKTYVDDQIIANATPEATTTVKGKVQLAGDLTGTAAAPIVADGVITTNKLGDIAVITSKIADRNVTTQKLADGAVTDAKIVTVSGSKVTGDIAGNATNVNGTVAVANGGTGAVTAAAARANLGLGNVDNTSDLNKPISTATQAALDTKENLSNKSTNTSLGTSDNLYPTQKAVKAYVDGQIIANATPDATVDVKGKLQLAGDLTGTAAAPIVADAAITTNKLSDVSVTTSKIADGNVTNLKLADGAVTDAKVVTVSGSKVTGDISGNASNVTGIVSISNGGTGSATKNFVDLSTNQTVGGNKTLTGDLQVTGTGSSSVQTKLVVGSASPSTTSAVLEANSTAQGFLPPRMTITERNAIQNPADGLLIFNTTTLSINLYHSGSWYQLSSILPAGTVTGFNTGAVVRTGTLISGVPASTVTASIPYTGGNGESYAGLTVTSTGVTGLTATLPAGYFNVGGGAILFTITGTPPAPGTATFTFTLGGQTTSFTYTVQEGSVTGITSNGGANTGTLIAGVPAGGGVGTVLSYTGGDGGTYGAQTVNSTGVTGLTATLPAGQFNTGSGTLPITITGTPSGPGTATFTFIIGGQPVTITFIVEAGTVSSIATSSATHIGILVAGLPATGVSTVISYTGSNGGVYDGEVVSSTGVTGLTATLSAGQFTSGSGSITYVITGTPTSVGTASFDINVGGQTGTLTRTVVEGSISSLSSGTATHVGTLVAGVTASGVSTTIPYTGGNGGMYVAQTISSTGVTGLAATLNAGSFANGAGTITYTITGTPSGSGTASFTITIGGQTVTFTRVVNEGSIGGLSTGSATHIGTLVAGIAASGATTTIAYIGGDGGTYNGQTVNSTGVTGLTATLAAGAFANGAGTITYTITGTPTSVGTASFAVTIGGQTGTFSRTVIEGSVTGLTSNSSANTGTLIAGVAASGVGTVLSYTGGNGGIYNTQSVSSTGVTGLTATIPAGQFTNGAGTITITVTGTPSGPGTATFTFIIGGQTVTITFTVLPGSITGLTIGAATHVGTLSSGVSASGVSTIIPYTGGDGGAYAAQTVSSTGITGLTATLSAGSFANGAGTITYTITGTPSGGGTASFTITLGGQTGTFTRTVTEGVIGSLTIGSATHVVSLVSGIAASGASTTIPYTGGNGGAYGGETVSSTGVTGLTATLSPGSFANGAGAITYTITGTPSSAGTASFAISIGGQSGTFTRTVSEGTIGSLTIGSATHVGTLTAGLVASGVSTSIPYTGGDGAGYNAQTVNSTGVTGLTATLSAGSFANGAGSITYTITGTPSAVGTASFAITIGGKTGTFTRTVTEGTIASLTIGAATHVGSLVSGIAASGTSTSIPYTGGDGGMYSAQTVSSSGVIGLTATLAAGSFANGAGTITYTITGTPASAGTASFAITIGGQTVTFTRNVAEGTITGLDIVSATHIGSLSSGVSASGVSTVIAYTGGDGAGYNAQTVSSTGVTGLTATLAAGSFANGAGTITYTITGTPSGGGTASFAISIGGQTGTFTRTVLEGTITSLELGSAIHVGTLNAGLSASGVTTEIPYTGGNGGAYPSQTINSTGVTGLTATITGGSFATGAGSLIYTITGTPSGGGTASFAISIGGQTGTFTRTVAAGTITTLETGYPTRTGTLIAGVAASGVSISIDYTGGNGGYYAAQTVNSTVVTGLTATLDAGQFNNGTGTLTYNITGTPAAIGNASFAISIGGRSGTVLFTANAGKITSLVIGSATHVGSLVKSVAASGVSSEIPYTGGDGGLHNGQTVTSTGVTGLTATLPAGQFAVGNGTVTYVITGTPSGVGTASFAINIGGRSTTLTRTVVDASISSLSIGDATHVGTLKELLLASGVSTTIPYTGGNGGAYLAQTVVSTGVTGLTARLSAGSFAVGAGTLTYTITGTPASSGTASFSITIGGQTATFTRTVVASSVLTLSEGTSLGTITDGVAISSATGTLVYTGGNGGGYALQQISSTGVTGLSLKIFAGNFADGDGTISYSISGTAITTGTASFAISLGGKSVTINRTVSPFQCGGTTTVRFEYMTSIYPNYSTTSVTPAPVTVYHGTVLNPITNKCWFDRNLGASRVGTSSNDIYAMGDLFQWGRLADGHQGATKYDGSINGYGVQANTNTLSTTTVPSTPKFILSSSAPHDWLVTSDPTLWQVATATKNNPCPAGWRVPTEAEWEAERASWSSNDAAGAFASPLKLTLGGYRHGRDGSGAFFWRGSIGYYWSSTIEDIGFGASVPKYLTFHATTANAKEYGERTAGYSIRCIKN